MAEYFVAIKRGTRSIRTMKRSFTNIGMGGILALICCGCILEHRTVSGGASGVVLDSASHQPVLGAKVGVAEYREDPPIFTNALKCIRKPIVVTDGIGYFQIPAKQRWVLTFPIGDYWPPPQTLVIQCAGYLPSVEQLPGVIPMELVSKSGVPEFLLQSETKNSAPR
jgi:hypothetical protein